MTVPAAWLEELRAQVDDWLRIPSISAGAVDEAGLQAAAEWALARVVEAGGTAELVPTSGGPPLVVGELRAAREDAPTVLVYGHYDVQDPGPPELWTSPPFEPTERDGRIYARGACDDKGNFLPLLFAACARARAGDLPVHVRVLVEGEEERGGDAVVRWVAEDRRGADCAVVFDSSMVDDETPTLTTAVRGLVGGTIEVTVADRDLHSGMYGGVALNAAHVLVAMLAAVLPGPDGRLREELRVGIAPPSDAELQSWRALPAGHEVLAAAGGRPVAGDAVADFHRRTGADASLDVNGLLAGEPSALRTIVPGRARANLSLRLAPGQEPEELRGVLERLLREAAAPGADVQVHLEGTGGALFDPEVPALLAARSALSRAAGGRPVALVRSGGSIPILGAFAAAGIPTVCSGYSTTEDALHAPDESFRVEALEQGLRGALALLDELGTLR